MNDDGNSFGTPGYIYAPYMPIYFSYSWVFVVGVDESYRDRSVFIIKHGWFDCTFIRYDFDSHRAWNGCYSIKSKRKLQQYRSACIRHLECTARNEPEEWYAPAGFRK